MGNKSKRAGRLGSPRTLSVVRPDSGRVSDYLRIRPDGNLEFVTARLPIPESEYDADFAWVRRRFQTVSLFFAKASPSEQDHLLTRLEVKYAPEAFYGNLWHNSRDFHRRLREIEGTLIKIEEEATPRDLEKMSATKDHSLWANLEVMSQSGSQACIDFFQLSPRAVATHAVTHDQQDLFRPDTVQPKVRVMLTSSALLRLLDMGQGIADEFEEKKKRKEAAP